MRTQIAVAIPKLAEVELDGKSVVIAQVQNGTPVLGMVTWLGTDGNTYGPFGALDLINIIEYP